MREERSIRKQDSKSGSQSLIMSERGSIKTHIRASSPPGRVQTVGARLLADLGIDEDRIERA